MFSVLTLSCISICTVEKLSVAKLKDSLLVIDLEKDMKMYLCICVWQRKFIDLFKKINRDKDKRRLRFKKKLNLRQHISHQSENGV